MSRNTITITAPNGAKVRTVHSKRYFVVRYGNLHVRYNRSTHEHVQLSPPEPFASVAKRTDSAAAAQAELRRCAQAVVFDVSADGAVKNQLDAISLGLRAKREKQNKALAARNGRQGSARSLVY